MKFRWKTKYQDVPFTCNADNMGVESKWYDDYISTEGKEYDIIMLVLPMRRNGKVKEREGGEQTGTLVQLNFRSAPTRKKTTIIPMAQ